jgi:hypothetical protein
LSDLISKCPKCGKENKGRPGGMWFQPDPYSSTNLYIHYRYCRNCHFYWLTDLMDTTKLENLIEKAIKSNEEFQPDMVEYSAGRYETLVAIKRYLEGDETELRKLSEGCLCSDKT